MVIIFSYAKYLLDKHTAKEVSNSMKVKCEVCGIDGYLQTLGSYHRVRHYVGIDPITKKSKFSYCPQTKEYIDRILASQALTNTYHLTTGIDLELSVSNPDCIEKPRAGIEPATYSLQGCCSTD